VRAPRPITRLAALLALVAAAGCAKRGGSYGTPPKPDPDVARRTKERTVVRVENLSFNDATVYVVRSGAQRIRLGFASGSRTTVLTIPESLVRFPTPLRFLADPVGSNRAPIGNEITVNPGDEVVLQIPPG
jgi:hypothetical protein